MKSFSPAKRPAAVDWTACDAELAAGLRALKLRVDAAARAGMIEYLRQLESWNTSYNLTAVRHPADMVVRHLLDSLAALPFITGKRVVDVGSGAGLPGIPIALARISKTVTLVEANGKKAAFLRHVLRSQGYANVEVVQQRVEDYRPARAFDTVICRAFAAGPEALRRMGHLCAQGGRVVLLKGRDPAAELAELPAGFQLREITRLDVPGLDAQRHVAVVAPGLL